MHKLHNSIRKTVRTIDGTMSEGVTPAGPRQSNNRLLPSNLVLSVIYIHRVVGFVSTSNGMEEILLAGIIYFR